MDQAVCATTADLKAKALGDDAEAQEVGVHRQVAVPRQQLGLADDAGHDTEVERFECLCQAGAKVCSLRWVGQRFENPFRFRAMSAV